MNLTLGALIAVTLCLLGWALLQPGRLATAGRPLTWLIFVVLPLTVSMLGTLLHLERSKSTEFCLSCPVMEPYGRSLQLADRDYLPARHVQDRLMAEDRSCYTCHTTYTMFGGLRAKMQGVQHLYVNYLGTIPEEIALYAPYQNRECLHCHGGARAFEESELHAEIREDLVSGDTSCLECHDLVHGIDDLEGAELWEGRHDG